jgi:hypothetical protein
MPEFDIFITDISDDAIRKDLVDQLRAKGADVLVFTDLIDRYVFYRRMEIEMQRDIAERGLTYTAMSAHGNEYTKDNPSIKNAVMYNKQCLAILTQLDLTTKTIEVTTAEDDDL